MSDTGSLGDLPFAHRIRGEVVDANAPLGFACRGCGELCCSNKDVFLSPPEAARIIWFLNRRPKLEQRLRDHGIAWGEVFVGEATGVPWLRLNFLPVFHEGKVQSTRCPFISPVVAGEGAQARAIMHWCGIHSARPYVCRLFPAGYIAYETPETPTEPIYVIAERCPGFAIPAVGDPIPPGYTPPDPKQTIAEWIALQDDPLQRIERAFFTQRILPALLDTGLHAPTAENIHGRLSDEEVLDLGHNILYNPPPPPQNPEYDHETLMEWMQQIVARIKRIR